MKTSEHIVSGPLLKTIFSLALPVVAGMFMEFALSVTDFYWVGKLGPAAQDAITSTMVVIWSVFAGINIISIGITALVSRHIGAGDPDQAAFFTQQGIAAAAGAALVLTVTGYLLTPSLLRFMGAGQDTLRHAIPYLRIFFLSAVFFWVSEVAYAAFRASGDTKTPTIVGIGMVALNMILDPVLIFGWGPFPRLGVPGASIATTISVMLSSSVILTLLLRGKAGFSPRRWLFTRPHIATVIRIARIGLPMASQQLIFIVVYWFLIKIVHQFGEIAGAAMGIGNRMESFSYLTSYGFGVAASTMVGQNLGAGNPDRAARGAWTAIGIGLTSTAVITILFLTIPETIAGIFTANSEVREIAVDYLIILGLSQVTMATEIILEGAFSGSGDTIPPMAVAIPGSIARIPLAYLLAFNLGLGINGVWWTLTITTVLKASVLAYWFSRGRWKLKVV
jgi:putative MATE family efflux protein